MGKYMYFVALMLFLLVFVEACERDERLFIGEFCDTNHVSYRNDIAPLILSCINCHNNNNKSGGISLEDFNSLKVMAQKGDLVRSIKTTMKRYFYGTECDFLKIQAWINQGLKNN